MRYSGELGHPFHVVDEDTVVLPLDHPFVLESRFASLLIRDRDLAQKLAAGFEGLWRKAMRKPPGGRLRSETAVVARVPALATRRSSTPESS